MESIDQLIREIQANADAAPPIIFGLVALSGLNLPVSEDIMLFVSASLAQARPDLFWSLFAAIYLGVLAGDTICYWVGRILGPKLSQVPWFAKMISPERVERVSQFYLRYGVATLIVGRFIPFGVRNGLYLTAGLGKMHFGRFFLSDLVAATLSTSVYFWLYYAYSHVVIDYVKQANIALFAVVGSAVILWILRGWFIKRRQHRSH